MPRWEPAAVDRLQVAAFDLFDEAGYDATTVAQIARRAGLTQRSYYNHFADKREVLFGLAAQFQDELLAAIGSASDATAPVDLVVDAAHRAAEQVFAPRRELVIRRHRIVNAHPLLLEREAGKGAALGAATTAALIARGVEPEAAFFAAGAGLLVEQAAFARWMEPEETRSLGELLATALRTMRLSVGDPVHDPSAQPGAAAEAPGR